jgi:hypothetical protein
MNGLLIAGVTVVAITGFFAYTRKYTKEITLIGTMAADIFIQYNDEDAMYAALAVKAMLSDWHGKRWMQKLDNWPFSTPATEAVARKAHILGLLERQASSSMECLALKEHLKEVAPDWYQAINKCDLNAAGMIEVLHMQKARKTQEEQQY